MKRWLAVVLLLGFAVLLSGTAYAAPSWQTEPILGYGSSAVTGDVVVITGPQPVDGGGNAYHDVDGNVVMGPTIPHYSIVGDPLFGIGAPSVTRFDPNSPLVTLGGAEFHWWPDGPGLEINSGSGIYLDAGHTYHWKQVFGAPSGAEVVWEDNFTDGGDGFVMLYGAGVKTSQIEAGAWSYSESWTDLATGAAISAERQFSVIPEPASLIVWSLIGGVGAAGAWLRRRRQNVA